MIKREPVSLSSDVFSYGMLLYEIFTGNLPFADTISDIMVTGKIVNGEVRMTVLSAHLKMILL